MTAGVRGAAPPPGQGSPRRAVALVLLAYLAFVAVKLALYHGDASRFVIAGDYFVDAAHLLRPIHVEPHSYGYDGQFYYRLAIDPLTVKTTDYGITIDSPVVRSQRIVYPALVWALSLGRVAALPWLLVAINLAGVAAIAWLGTLLARRWSIPAGLGALLALYPGFVLSISRDTPEIVAGALTIAAIVLADGRRWVAAGLVAAVAVLAKETTLLWLAGYGVAGLWRLIRTRRGWAQVAGSLLPVVAFVLWQVMLTRRWGSLPSGELGAHDLGLVPFLDYGRYVAGYLREVAAGPIRYRILYESAAIVTIGGLVATVATMLVRRGDRPLGLVLPWLLYLALAALFTGDIWDDGYGFVRVLSDLYLLSVLLLLRTGGAALHRRLRVAVGVLWIGAVAYAL